MSYTKTQWNNDTAPAINETNLNKIEQGIYDNDSHIGDLSDLETTAQNDLVSAINENVSSIGDLTTLTTTANTDLVSAINEVDNNTNTNTSSIDNLEDMTNGTKPMGDIIVDSIRTKNMYNALSDLQNLILNSSGGLTQGTGYVTSVYIKVKPSTDYTISKVINTAITDPSIDNTMRIGYFTSSKTFISRPTSTNNPYSVTTPANCEYVRISYQHTISGQEYCYNVQLEEGSTATAYSPYQELNNQRNEWTDISASITVYPSVIPGIQVSSAMAKISGGITTLKLIFRTQNGIPAYSNLGAFAVIDDKNFRTSYSYTTFCRTNNNYDYPIWDGDAENIAWLRVSSTGEIQIRTKVTGQKAICIDLTY